MRTPITSNSCRFSHALHLVLIFISAESALQLTCHAMTNGTENGIQNLAPPPMNDECSKFSYLPSGAACGSKSTSLGFLVGGGVALAILLMISIGIGLFCRKLRRENDEALAAESDGTMTRADRFLTRNQRLYNALLLSRPTISSEQERTAIKLMGPYSGMKVELPGNSDRMIVCWPDVGDSTRRGVFWSPDSTVHSSQNSLHGAFALTGLQRTNSVTQQKASPIDEEAGVPENSKDQNQAQKSRFSLELSRVESNLNAASNFEVVADVDKDENDGSLVDAGHVRGCGAALAALQAIRDEENCLMVNGSVIVDIEKKPEAATIVEKQ